MLGRTMLLVTSAYMRLFSEMSKTHSKVMKMGLKDLISQMFGFSNTSNIYLCC